MKRLALGLLMLSTGIIALAQEASISGKVTDAENNPLEGASVSVEGTTTGAITNAFGEFTLVYLKPGSYLLTVSYLGYETTTLEVQTGNETGIEVQLSPTTYLSEETVITAIRANSKTPVTQTNLTFKEIDKIKMGDDVPFQLELTPSVVATSENGTGMGYTGMRIRGTDMTRINVTVNGIPLNDSESQNVFWVNMSDFTSSVNDVQIQRGVGTSTNGAASFGASVNFQTLSINPEAYGNLSTTFGSFNTIKGSIAAGTGLIRDHFTFDLRYSKLNSDGYILRGFSDHESMYLSGSYSDDKNLLKAVVMLGNERTGITWWGVPDIMLDSIRNYNPAGEYYDDDGNQQFYDGQTDNYWQNHYQLMFTHKFSNTLNINAALHATTGKGYYEQYKASDNLANYGISPINIGDTMIQQNGYTYIFPDSTISASDLIRQKWLDNVFYGYTITLNYHKNRVTAALGTSWNNYDGDHFGKVKWMKFNAAIPHEYEWYNNKGVKTDLNGFAKIQYALTDNLSAFADIQYRHIKYELEGPDDDLLALDQKHEWDFLNPKAGLTYILNKSNKFYIYYAIANREPSRTTIKEAIKVDTVQTPKNETLYDLEFGYLFTNSILAVNANFYYMDYKDQLVLTGKLNNVGNPIMTNVDKSYRMGIELGVGLKPIKEFEWNFNLTLSQNKIKDFVEYAEHYDEDWDLTVVGKELGETDISYSPNIVGSSVITYKPIDNLSLNWITKHVGDQYIDNTSNNARKLDAYFVNKLRFDYHLPLKGWLEMNFQFAINNIFDTDYISNAYGGNWYEQGEEMSWVYYYPQAGRNYMFRLDLRF